MLAKMQVVHCGCGWLWWSDVNIQRAGRETGTGDGRVTTHSPAQQHTRRHDV